ncbi:hypothetical protein [Bradyrhizobium guangxiense]|uniref:hypothetical protein n=1 Tax=Bradyrhizobium guangxiense TaxID=1325115 RepID=UPI003D3181F5
MPSITAVCLVIFALACAALAVLTIRLQRSRQAVFNGGVLLAMAFAVAAALPILSRLPWAELAEEASDQALAAIQLLHAAYVILTL